MQSSEERGKDREGKTSFWKSFGELLPEKESLGEYFRRQKSIKVGLIKILISWACIIGLVYLVRHLFK
jgi:hypothetical protein